MRLEKRRSEEKNANLSRCKGGGKKRVGGKKKQGKKCAGGVSEDKGSKELQNLRQGGGCATQTETLEIHRFNNDAERDVGGGGINRRGRVFSTEGGQGINPLPQKGKCGARAKRH